MALLIPVVVAFATALGLGGCASTRTLKTSEKPVKKDNYGKCMDIYEPLSVADRKCTMLTKEFSFINNPNFDKCYDINKKDLWSPNAASKCIEATKTISLIDNPNFDKCYDLHNRTIRASESFDLCVEKTKYFSFVDNPNFDKCYFDVCKRYSINYCIKATSEVSFIDDVDFIECYERVIYHRGETERQYLYFLVDDIDKQCFKEAHKRNQMKIASNVETEEVLMSPAEIRVSGVLGETHFKTNGFELTESAKEILDEIAAKMETENELTIEIIGSADGQGKDTDNMNLSTKRALYAYEYLTKEKGVDPKRIKQIISVGENEALAEVSEESRSITVRARI